LQLTNKINERTLNLVCVSVSTVVADCGPISGPPT